MCGIAGIFHYKDLNRAVDRDLLTRMTRTLVHRGPDDEGFFVDGPIGLGHRRLTIVDLCATGHQPMATADGSAWIAYNGEYYNHHAARDRLASRGYTFRGTADTETMLYALREFGPACLADAAGIFSFAYWDTAQRTLILARDPLGVKQLYYYDDGQRIFFASEIKALLQSADIPRQLDGSALNQYIHFHTPLFERTFFHHIKQLLPGEYIEVTQRGLRHTRYWQLSEEQGTQPVSTEQNVEQLRQLIDQVVREQLMSDVPVGAFFSGGIDSTAVAAFARNTGKLQHCFGVHFTGQGVIDERPFQEAAAKALGLQIDLITFDGNHFPDDMQRLLYFQDQPVIGAAMLPMYYVSQLAARSVKVCLGGQGADELFAGYARYAMVNPLQTARSFLHAKWSDRHQSKKQVRHLATESTPSGRATGNLLKQLLEVQTLRRLFASARHLADYRARYFEHFSKVPQALWSALIPNNALFDRAAARDYFNHTLERSPYSDPMQQILHWDVQTYLPGLFQQDDRMSMANSLESRVPLSDPRMVRFAFQTPPMLKVRGTTSKWILRQAVADQLPDMVLYRRKVGFDTPASTWMRNQHAGFVRDTLLSTTARQRGWTDATEVSRWLDNTTHPNWFDITWKLLCLEIWAKTFVDG